MYGGRTGRSNYSTQEKNRNLIELDDSVGPGTKKLSYADALGGKSTDKGGDFPNLRTPKSERGKQSRFMQAIKELEKEECGLIDGKNDRNSSRSELSRRREQVINGIVNKLREELKIDVLRIIREEVRENLRAIIGNAIREEVADIFQEGGSSVVRRAVRVSFDENVRERVVGCDDNIVMESESEIVDRSSNEK